MISSFEKKYLIVFGNCVPVRGYLRSVICDLQKQTIDVIPNDLYNILTSYNGFSYEDILDSFGIEHKNIIDEYFVQLVKREYVMFGTKEEIEYFPRISDDWNYAGEINNAIIDIGIDSKFDLPDIFNQLENLGCEHIQLRYYYSPSWEGVQQILRFLHTIDIRSIDLLLATQEKYQELNYQKECLIFPKLSTLILYNCKEDKIDTYSDGSCQIIFTTDELSDEKHCGKVHPYYFNSNVYLFTESKKFNSCLNRKISVDVNGNIKNCPSLHYTYGNVAQTSLYDALKSNGFSKFWNITKDEIATCRDCEFRYVCTDCRAYIQNPQDIFSKPLKCGYNPYTTEWTNWHEDESNFSAIMHYKLSEIAFL